IETVTGASSEHAMRDLLLTPLGLRHSGTGAGDFITHRFALGHDARLANSPLLQRPFVASTNLAAGGVGLLLVRLLPYAGFHLGDGTSTNGTRGLNRSSLDLMRAAQLRKQGTDDDMGIGWHLRNVGPLRVVAHGGSFPGHHVLLEMVPERNFAIGIL